MRNCERLATVYRSSACRVKTFGTRSPGSVFFLLPPTSLILCKDVPTLTARDELQTSRSAEYPCQIVRALARPGNIAPSSTRPGEVPRAAIHAFDPARGAVSPGHARHGDRRPPLQHEQLRDGDRKGAPGLLCHDDGKRKSTPHVQRCVRRPDVDIHVSELMPATSLTGDQVEGDDC